MARNTKIQSGALNSVVTFEESYQSGTGRANEAIMAWRTYRQVFAEAYSDFYTRRNNEQIEENQVYSASLIQFRCRYYDVDGVTTKMKAVFNGVTYDIKSIQPDHRQREFAIIEASVKE